MRIYYFSGSGHTLTVANALAELLCCEIRPVSSNGGRIPEETAAVIFPVYCQNIPDPVREFLKGLKADNVALIATYGKISYGNVLYEAQRLVRGQIIAGACIPIGHTFLDGDHSFDRDFLLPIARRMRSPQKAVITVARKNPLANIFPALRSRIGVTITKGPLCDGCGLCEKTCPMGAIRNGCIGRNCIRCMHCVAICPRKALQYRNSRILHGYLKRYHKEEYVLYL